MTPGPCDYDIKSLSPVKTYTIGSDKLFPVVLASKVPKKVTIDLHKCPAMPSAQVFLQKKPAGLQIAPKIL